MKWLEKGFCVGDTVVFAALDVEGLGVYPRGATPMLCTLSGNYGAIQEQRVRLVKGTVTGVWCAPHPERNRNARYPGHPDFNRMDYVQVTFWDGDHNHTIGNIQFTYNRDEIGFALQNAGGIKDKALRDVVLNYAYPVLLEDVAYVRFLKDVVRAAGQPEANGRNFGGAIGEEALIAYAAAHNVPILDYSTGHNQTRPQQIGRHGDDVMQWIADGVALWNAPEQALDVPRVGQVIHMNEDAPPPEWYAPEPQEDNEPDNILGAF